ncbi:MAG: hypothetical protein QX196_09315, partial [Methylococcaceae bacterium]
MCWVTLSLTRPTPLPHSHPVIKKASQVGRNKSFRAQARTSVSGTLHDIAGNATTRYAWVVLFRPTPLPIYV